MASPAFFIVKPNGSLRLLIDFRHLNKYLRRSPYYVPRIREILIRLGGAKCFTTLDANMGYYARQLALQSRKYTAFCLPFGKFQYKRLPMGISTAPDEYQACMEKFFGDLSFVVVYLDDILIFSKTEKEHLEHLKIVFQRLEEYNITLNPKKCHFLRKEVDYLGFVLTPEGIKPQEKKIQAILQLQEPTTKRQLRRFLGMLNYYRDMIPSKASICAPLNKLTSKNVPFNWTEAHRITFQKLKQAFAQAVLLAFPDFTKPFDVFADASGLQLGGLIMQGNKIIACYSRTLNAAQKNYTTMELELLSIVEILIEYRTLLLGFEIVVHTDHKNLVPMTEKNMRVKRWKLLLAEYKITFKYVKGETNIGADAFSRLPKTLPSENSLAEELYQLNDTECVLDGAIFKREQLADGTCHSLVQACARRHQPPDYQLRPALGHVLLHYQKKIFVPSTLRTALIEFYHVQLMHPGLQRQLRTMQPFYWPLMSSDVDRFVTACLTCKKAKKHGGPQAYGELPAKTLKHNQSPFDVVHMDLLGPFDDNHYALVCVEAEFRWVEIGLQKGKQADTTAYHFEKLWICRYPKPLIVVHDQGTEFMGSEFQEMLSSLAIKSKCITRKNPQANAIVERVNLEIGNVLRTRPDVALDDKLQYAAYALRSSWHSVLNATPGQLLFGQDMITRQLHFSNWSYLSKRRLQSILQDNQRENLRRLQHFYQIGDQVMVKIPDRERRKQDPVAKGPFLITEVNSDGTVNIDKGSTQERVHLRNIFPC